MLRYFGRNLLVFYTAHFAITAVAFKALQALGLTNPALMFPALQLARTTICYALAMHRAKTAI